MEGSRGWFVGGKRNAVSPRRSLSASENMAGSRARYANEESGTRKMEAIESNALLVNSVLKWN